ncbi:MAG: HAMP domain-containing histidine kinase, partial [Campylobacteraceae bacterium]|nr:HAMP domain-containing histidine kinase [Campylobacteraceae bacterium]
MKKNMPYIILLLSIIYISIHIFYFPLIEDEAIEFSSVLSEGLIALITLFSIFVLNINNKKIYSLMFLGLSLIYAAMVTDTLDEIYNQPDLIALIMEDIALIVGFIFINLGIYSWSNYSTVLRIELEKRVNDEVEKNKNKEIIIFNQSKLSAMGEMITSIAHQWRQPLNALAGSVQMISLDYEDDLIDKKYLENFEKENMDIIHYMSKTIDDFRDFAKNNKNKEIVNIKDFIKDSFTLFKTQLDDQHIDFELTGDECKIDIIKN